MKVSRGWHLPIGSNGNAKAIPMKNRAKTGGTPQNEHFWECYEGAAGTLSGNCLGGSSKIEKSKTATSGENIDGFGRFAGQDHTKSSESSLVLKYSTKYV